MYIAQKDVEDIALEETSDRGLEDTGRSRLESSENGSSDDDFQISSQAVNTASQFIGEVGSEE